MIKMSAVLPNYNSAKFLPKSIQSLLNQTESFTEIVIVDDGSTDDSLALINDFMSQYKNIRLIKHEKNLGVAQALNTGITHAIGDFVILCAADDWYHHTMVALAKQAIAKFPQVGLVCGDAIVHRFDKSSSFRRTLPYIKNSFITAEDFKSLTKQKYVGFNGGGGMFMNRQAILAAGLLCPELRWHSDWLLYFAIALQRGIYYLDGVFVFIDMRAASYSEGKNNWKIQKQVMMNTVEVISKRHPDLWNNFKEAALLPYYSLRCIPLFLLNTKMRKFFTFSLLWKFIINNNLIVKIGRLFPYRVILTMRKLLKA